jgi:cholesterol 25-hydroxylase
MRIGMQGHKVQKTNKGKLKASEMQRPSKHMGEATTYVSPLLLMDFTMLKKFAGVPMSDIRDSGDYRSLTQEEMGSISLSFLLNTLHNFSWKSSLQLRRALPPSPPTSRRLVLELMTALFICDTLFFVIYLAFHRIELLARIHRPHRAYAEIHLQVTNWLSIAQRLSLILLANFSLITIRSHVPTHTAFIPFFVKLLVHIYLGLDLPWDYDNILPFGMGAGSRVHAIHHRIGEGAFQSFF